MSTLDQFKRGLQNTWSTISDGWHQFSERTAQALTRFNPIHHVDSDSASNQVEKNASRWGLLAAEIHEDDSSVYVKVEAPGMQPNDFDIQIIDNILVVRGEKRIQSEKTEGRYHMMECAYGSFERALALPSRVNEDKTTARYNNGILNIEMPKMTKTSNGKISVSS